MIVVDFQLSAKIVQNYFKSIINYYLWIGCQILQATDTRRGLYLPMAHIRHESIFKNEIEYILQNAKIH